MFRQLETKVNFWTKNKLEGIVCSIWDDLEFDKSMTSQLTINYA